MKQSLVIVIGLTLVYTNTNLYGNTQTGTKFMYTPPAIKTAQDIVKLFPTSTEQVQKRTDLAIEKAQTALDDILCVPDSERTFDNTARALDTLLKDFGQEYQILRIIQMTYPDKTMRDATFAAEQKMNEFYVDTLGQNKAIYQAFKEYVNKRPQESLNPEELYYLDETLKDFKRGGLELPDEQQEKIKKLKKEIAKVSQEFDKNINEDNRTIDVRESDLAGLSEEFIHALPCTVKDGVTIRTLNTSAPIYNKIMEECSVESTRKALWQLYHNKAYPANEKLLNDLISLRDKLAGLLGYQSYAQVNIEDEMAQTPEKVDAFLKDIENRSLPKAEQEIDRYIEDLPKNITLTTDNKIKPWDFDYIKNHYKKEHYKLDPSLIAQYFPVQSTLEELLAIYEEFLSLKFIPIKIDGLWSSDVKAVQVNTADGNLIGYLLLDLYPRDNKYAHACQATIVSALLTKEGVRLPAVGLVVANFPKPTQNNPGLLSHQGLSSVLTFFHEFGHALHALLGATQLTSFSGTNVKHDFVEMPSQMLEQWMWDKNIIKRVSKHYKTGKPLPDNIIDTMILLKNFDTGTFVRRQLVYAFLSLNLFKTGAHKDAQSLQNSLMARLMFYLEDRPENHKLYSFGHLTGYDAKYYSYLWAEVYAHDMFEYIKTHGGLLDPKMGKRYIDCVLSKGGSKPPMELIKAFLGREPKSDAFFKNMGI